MILEKRINANNDGNLCFEKPVIGVVVIVVGIYVVTVFVDVFLLGSATRTLTLL